MSNTNYNSREFRNQVRALRNEAVSAGDAEQIKLCNIVLCGVSEEGAESATEGEFDAAAKECERVIMEAKCEACHGEGTVRYTEPAGEPESIPCPDCNGGM